MKKIPILVSGLLAVVVAGCASFAGGSVARVGLVWLSADEIYVVRSDDSGRKEVWRRNGDSEVFVARGADIPNACGPVDFLFRAGAGKVGIALECPDGERLISYTPASGAFDVLRDIKAAAEVALLPSGRGGYQSSGINGCWSVSYFGAEQAAAFDLSSFSCDGGGSAKSPQLLANGDLVFLATDARPLQQPVRYDMRTWHVHVSGPGTSGPRKIGPDLVGFPEMDVSAEGTTAVVALTREDGGRLISIDLTSGESRELVESSYPIGSPSISPDGSRVTFIEDYKSVIVKKVRS